MKTRRDENLRITSNILRLRRENCLWCTKKVAFVWRDRKLLRYERRNIIIPHRNLLGISVRLRQRTICWPHAHGVKMRWHHVMRNLAAVFASRQFSMPKWLAGNNIIVLLLPRSTRTHASNSGTWTNIRAQPKVLFAWPKKKRKSLERVFLQWGRKSRDCFWYFYWSIWCRWPDTCKNNAIWCVLCVCAWNGFGCVLHKKRRRLTSQQQRQEFHCPALLRFVPCAHQTDVWYKKYITNCCSRLGHFALKGNRTLLLTEKRNETIFDLWQRKYAPDVSILSAFRTAVKITWSKNNFIPWLFKSI